MDDPGGDRELARKLSSPGGPKPGRKPSSGPARQNLIAAKSLPKIDHLYSGKLLFTGPGPGCVWSGYLRGQLHERVADKTTRKRT